MLTDFLTRLSLQHTFIGLRFKLSKMNYKTKCFTGAATPDGEIVAELVEDYFSPHSTSADVNSSDVSSFEEIDAQELASNDTVGKLI